MVYYFVIAATIGIFLLPSVYGQIEECEVCIDVFTEIMERFDVSGEKGHEAVRDNIVNYCKSVKGKDEKKEKLCFFIGAHPDSATSILVDIAKPLSYHKPPKKKRIQVTGPSKHLIHCAIGVCAELKEKDSQICSLKYDKPIDWDSLELDKMRVKQLKELLLKLGDNCKGCTEKIDYIARINELKPKLKVEL